MSVSTPYRIISSLVSSPRPQLVKMAYEIPTHHGSHRHGWHTSTGHYPILRGTFADVNEEPVTEGWSWGAHRTVKEPPALPTVHEHGKNRIYRGNKEDVDAEANLFIKHEHRKFEERKWVPLDS